jgi:DNA modification methylase
MYKLKERLDLGNLVTFVPNKNLPVYNWLYFKEGFSRDFVFLTLEKFNVKENNVVLDPFCGCGTTLLACKQKGINAIGFDVLPIAVFSSRVKLRDYETEELKLYAKEILNKKFKRYEIPKRFLKYFSKYILEDIIFFKNEINKIEDEKIRDFMLLALINASMRCSYVFKDGGVIKIKKRYVAPLREMFRRRVLKMIKDLSSFEKKKCEVFVDFGDARNLKIEDETIDFIITSPPYLNKIEYTKVYEIEEEIFLSEKAKPGIRSFIEKETKNATILKDVENALNKSLLEKISQYPNAIAYANDIYLSIKEMYRVCKNDSLAAIVIGDGVFVEDNVVIEGDKLLADIASYCGFIVKEIIIVNKRFYTTPKRIKKGIIKEYIVILKKFG